MKIIVYEIIGIGVAPDLVFEFDAAEVVVNVGEVIQWATSDLEYHSLVISEVRHFVIAGVIVEIAVYGSSTHNRPRPA